MIRLVIIITLICLFSISANPLIGKWEFNKERSWNSKEVKQIELQEDGKKQVLIYFSVMNKMYIELDSKKMKTALKSSGKSTYYTDLYTIVKKSENKYYLKLSGKSIRYAIISIENKNIMRIDLNLNDRFKKTSNSPPIYLSKKDK